MLSADDDALIAELRPRLKVPRSSALPQSDHVGLALRLACDESIDPSKGNFWPQELTSSATRTRIKTLATRMVHEGHLAAARLALAQPASERPPRATEVVGKALRVSAAWIEENAPGLRDVTTTITFSDCGRYAVRSICAQNQYSEEEVHCEFSYELPPACGESVAERQARADVHRRQEESAIRQLDGVAAVEHRRKKTRRELEARQAWIAVSQALSDLCSQVESLAAFEFRWRCPGGCDFADESCALLRGRVRTWCDAYAHGRPIRRFWGKRLDGFADLPTEPARMLLEVVHPLVSDGFWQTQGFARPWRDQDSVRGDILDDYDYHNNGYDYGACTYNDFARFVAFWDGQSNPTFHDSWRKQDAPVDCHGCRTEACEDGRCCQRRRFFENASAEELNRFTECGPSGSVRLKADLMYQCSACATREEVEQSDAYWKERRRIDEEREAKRLQPWPPILRPDLGPGWWCTCCAHDGGLRPTSSIYGSGRCHKCGARRWQGAWEAYTDAQGRLAEKRWHVLRHVHTSGKILPTMCESDCALCERTSHLGHKPWKSNFDLADIDRLVTDTFGHESGSASERAAESVAQTEAQMRADLKLQMLAAWRRESEAAATRAAKGAAA